jgi:hypothetical protein
MNSKYLNTNTTVSHKSVNKKDKKFYKRRIFDLTKQLLNNEKPERMYPDVTSAFDMYANICIEYFKILDKTDIIQEDYDNILAMVDAKNEIPVENNQEEINKLLMRSIKITEPNALEKLVKRTSTQVAKKPPIIPIQKDINLHDPVLKNKGIRKKNNIMNTYEENSKKETNETLHKT